MRWSWVSSCRRALGAMLAVSMHGGRSSVEVVLNWADGQTGTSSDTWAR